jgi:tetratricopeptide (TPR) repeat protein
MDIYPASSARQLNWFIALGLVLCSVAVYKLQEEIDSKTGAFRSTEEILYFPSGRILKKLSLGHYGLLADIYWMRTVQYYGGKRLNADKRFDLLEPLINIATTLDPSLLYAYRFGAIFLSEREPVGANQPRKAIELLKKGIERNPQEWMFYRDLGFVYYWFLHDYSRAAAAFLEGSKLPDAKPWMKTFAAELLAKGGSRETARMLWQEAFDTATDARIKENAKENLLALAAQDDMELLQGFITRIQQKVGKPVVSLEELVQLGVLKRYPLDPKGFGYLLNPSTGKVELSPESTIRRIDQY